MICTLLKSTDNFAGYLFRREEVASKSSVDCLAYCRLGKLLCRISRGIHVGGISYTDFDSSSLELQSNDSLISDSEFD